MSIKILKNIDLSIKSDTLIINILQKQVIKINIGEYIKNVRLEKGLTSRKLAEKSGVSQPYISQLENGKNNNPSPEILKKLSETLDINYTDLMEMAGYIDEKNSLERAISKYSKVLKEIDMIIQHIETYESVVGSVKNQIEGANKEEEMLINENNKIKEQLELFNQQEQMTKEHVALLEKQIKIFNHQEQIKKRQIHNNQMIDAHIRQINDLKQHKQSLLNELSENRINLEKQIEISFNNAIDKLDNHF